MAVGPEDSSTGTDGARGGWMVLAAMCLSLTVIVVDNTILNVALPTIGADLAADSGQMEVIVNAYVVVFAGLLVVSGLLCDRYGRRRVLVIGLSILSLASVAATLARTAGWLILARAAMGVGAAQVMPAALAIIVRTFTGRRRVTAFAAWSAVGSAAMAAGPLVGGFLVERWSWGSVFLADAILAALAVLLIVVVVPESHGDRDSTIDAPAAIGLTVALAALVLLISSAPTHGVVSRRSAGLLLLAVGGGSLFGLRQRRAESPMIDLGLYRCRRFSGGSAAVAVLAIGTGSVLFILTQYLQSVLGYSPLRAGAAVIPLALGVVAASPVGARLPDRIGGRRSIITGFAVTACGFLTLAVLTPHSAYAVVAVGLFIAGAGSGLGSPAVQTTVLGAVPPGRAGMGSALNDTHQQLGIGLGISLVGTLTTVVYRHLAPTALGVRPGESLGGSLGRIAPSDTSLVDAALTAFTDAQSVAMITCAAFAVAGAVIAGTVLRDDPSR